MKRSLLLLKLFALFMAISCETGKDNIPIKQLRIELWGSTPTTGTTSANGVIMSNEIYYQNFNKNNYPGLQSIYFNARLMSSQTNNTCFLEIYNLTDQLAIDSSMLTSSYPVLERLETANLMEFFPEHDIDLSVRLRSETNNIFVGFSSAYLYLYME
jgi:hypothetical protein